MGAIPLLSAARGGEASQYDSGVGGCRIQAGDGESTSATGACHHLLFADGRGSAQSGDSNSPLLATGGGGTGGRQNRGSSACSSSSRSEESGVERGGEQGEGRAAAFSHSCFPLRRSMRVGWQRGNSSSRDQEPEPVSGTSKSN
jgi:hypothetical protein